MPRIKYREYKPQKQAREIIQQCDVILREYAANGYDLTLRQAYYQLVSRDLLPDSWADKDGIKNTMASYVKLKGIITKARVGGMIDWNHIKDRARKVSKYRHYDDPEDFVRRFVPQFLMDMWANQPKRVEVWFEKDALSQVFELAADPYDVPTFATKGYSSVSAMWEAGHLRFRQWASRGQEVVILHMGDHDPSGIHMTQDAEERLSMFSGGAVTIKRIALNMDQVEQYNPPNNPAKMTDTRAPAYVEQYGDNSWELDALNPEVLTALVEDHIEAELDQDIYVEKRMQEANYRRQLEQAADNWDAVVEYLVNEGLISEDDD